MGADSEECGQRGGFRGRLLQHLSQGIADAGLVGELRQAQHFLVAGRAIELREQLGNTSGADSGFKRKYGEEAILERESVGSGRIEKRGHGLWMLRKEKPDEVSLELAFVSDARLDGPAVVGAHGGGFGKWSAGQGHTERHG